MARGGNQFVRGIDLQHHSSGYDHLGTKGREEGTVLLLSSLRFASYVTTDDGALGGGQGADPT